MRLIDISHPISPATPVYAGDNPISLIKRKCIEDDMYNAYELATTLHTGTHADAPMHITRDPRWIGDFSLEHFAGNGVLLDVRGEEQIGMKPKYAELIRPQDVVLLYTGYDAHFGEPEYFTHHPMMTQEFAEFLAERKIKMLGMDIPSPDRRPFEVHKCLMRADIIILENLTNLYQLEGISSFEVYAPPLRLTAEASLVRAFCRVDM